MNHPLHKQIVSIINDVNDMTIATVRDDGFPQATTVSYFNDGEKFILHQNPNRKKPKIYLRIIKCLSPSIVHKVIGTKLRDFPWPLKPDAS